MKKNRVAAFFLLLALISFGLDLFYFTHHLSHEGALLELAGVWQKLVWKTGWVVLVGGLLALEMKRVAWFVAIGLWLSLGENPGFSAMTHESCERAKEFMKESGLARDAKENFFGRLKIKPPRSSFPPEMDKVTWWGTFKPFEFWESPKFEAAWISPQGQEAGRGSFRGNRCQLAKTSLDVTQLPQGRLEPGMWRVIVTCEDVVIDNHPFPVIGSGSSPQDAGGREGGVMIWADGVDD